MGNTMGICMCVYGVYVGIRLLTSLGVGAPCGAHAGARAAGGPSCTDQSDASQRDPCGTWAAHTTCDAPACDAPAAEWSLSGQAGALWPAWPPLPVSLQVGTPAAFWDWDKFLVYAI
jgi:hypothetical protein